MFEFCQELIQFNIGFNIAYPKLNHFPRQIHLKSETLKLALFHSTNIHSIRKHKYRSGLHHRPNHHVKRASLMLVMMDDDGDDDDQNRTKGNCQG